MDERAAFARRRAWMSFVGLLASATLAILAWIETGLSVPFGLVVAQWVISGVLGGGFLLVGILYFLLRWQSQEDQEVDEE